MHDSRPTNRSNLRQLAVPFTGVLLSAALGCSPEPRTRWLEAEGYRWRPIQVTGRGETGFTQLSPSATGLDFTNPVSQEPLSWTNYVGHGSGVALGDVDGDGLVDIYLASVEGPNVLYRNLGGWRFVEEARERGVDAPGRASAGTVFADVDGDGDLDLLLSALGGPNSLFLNDGSGVFAEAGETAGLTSDRASGTMSLADVDGDGDLDLYTANYKIGSAEDLFEPGEVTFENVIRRVAGRYEIAPRFREFYRLRELPELGMVAHIERAQPDWFYLNDGRGRFEPVSFTGGQFLDEDGKRLTEAPDYFTLAVRFYDVDLDGDPDLYVCNDFDDPDLFWINQGMGVFQLIPRLALRATSSATMAVDFSDIDRDGDVDFFETDMLSRDNRRRKAQRPSYTPLPKLVGNNENRPQVQRNTLFVNRGDNTYAQIAEYAGVAASDWTWGTLFLDVDLDGYEDMLVTTGHLWDQFDDDYQNRMRRMPAGLDWREARSTSPTLETSNYAFRNNGDLTFDDVSVAWRFGNEADISHGIAVADLDDDGDLDVIISRLGAPVGVFRNDASANRLAVRLVGLAPNTRAIGAKISVHGGAVPEQRKEVTAGGMFLSGSDQLYTFAAGDATELTVTIDWRSGRRTVVEHVRPNSIYEIRESGKEPVGNRVADSIGVAAARTFFVDYSVRLGHVHRDTLFDDYARQPLLPHKLSQLGPGVTWYDVDEDGYEDLLIPSGRSGRLAYFRNVRDGFTRVPLGIPPAQHDQTMVLGVPDRGGRAALLLASAAYEALTAAEALTVPAVTRIVPGSPGAAASAGVAPGTTSSTGPIAVADIDGDADLDLFVGGRVEPTLYPTPASSRLLRNEDGTFHPDSANNALLADIGLVSAAVFSDIDGDGDPDLLLALDWGPIKVFRNVGGRLSDATATLHLAELSSKWNGITTGDLNGDGRLDIVATSWGRNTKYKASRARPLLLYHGDFDRNGTLDVLLAQYDERLGAIAPLEENRSLLIDALPYIGRRIPSSRAYADATLSEVLGDGLADAGRLEAASLDHMVFWNRGDRFEAAALPTEAQLTPSFYAGIVDLDGDGNEDLFLSQNFYPTAITEPRYDAGRGLWLRGDGKGGFAAVPGQQSGILVYGDQRGAAFADFDADGRVDLAVSQNGRETMLFHNEGAAPGLRVRLAGPAANPHAIGAVLRLMYADRRGPAREIHGGSGYWSQDGPVQVLGGLAGATAVWVRWPGGEETETALEPGQREITLRVGGD